jgi:iron complex transport system ATP-binding protein
MIIGDVSLAIPPGQITALIGPNGSGKSTLLKTLARQLSPEAGQVLLDGSDIATLSPRQLAQRIGILFQENNAPGDLTAEGLVHHGRYPHRRLFESLTVEDYATVDEALRLAGVVPLRQRRLNHLSSGQKQLAWIAMLLAQEPQYLFLDEPTTFLDLEHQLDVMECLRRLNRDAGKTIVLVMHDLNLAARYADHIFALQAGRIVASGPPAAVLSKAILQQVFNIEAEIIRDDAGHIVACVPVRVAAT